ncbi:unnamed protein product [Absidia cylindrospora]
MSRSGVIPGKSYAGAVSTYRIQTSKQSLLHLANISSDTPSQQNRDLELYPSDTILKRFLAEGILYADAKLRILPCKAIEGKGKVIHLKLTDIPILPKADIISGLTGAFSKFGTLKGYAIIQQDETSKYPSLQHHISWPSGEYCYAHLVPPTISFFILNIYAPVSTNVERRTFFDNITNLLQQIISGDFSYDMHRDIALGTVPELLHNGLGCSMTTPTIACYTTIWTLRQPFNDR